MMKIVLGKCISNYPSAILPHSQDIAKIKSSKTYKCMYVSIG